MLKVFGDLVRREDDHDTYFSCKLSELAFYILEMKGNPSHRSGSQFAFTCLMMISVFSTTTVHAAHSWESPSFKIERKVNLEAIVSCGEGMLQGKHDSMCRLSANEGTV